MAIIPTVANKTVRILLVVISGLLGIIDEQSLMIQKLIGYVQEVEDESS